MIQVFYATEIAFVVGIVAQLLVGFYPPAIILFVSGIIIYPVKALAEKGKSAKGRALLLVIITLMVSLLILIYQGVKNVSLMAFQPC